MPGSLRHPEISLRDKVALKLLMLARPGQPVTPFDMDRARELIDDLAEYVKDAFS